MEGVRITRPEKMADLRIKDILDGTDPDTIKDAIAEMGNCEREEVRVGILRSAANGLNTVWAQCPIRAANKVAAAGKMRVGWITS